jgi:transcriptional regulator with XRE-family HTH domain
MNDTLAEKIKAIRVAHGMTQGEFAEMFQSTQSTVSRWERGAEPEHRHLLQLAEMAGTTVETLLGVANMEIHSLTDIPVVGYVSAGAEVLPIESTTGGGMALTDRPDGVVGQASALDVRGDSLFPTAENGWKLIYADSDQADESDMLNRLCVVKLASGKTLVKRVMRGSKPGRYHLVSTNAPVIEDAQIKWAARVKAIIPT